MKEITYKPTSTEKEIKLEDKDFMIYTLLNQVLSELKRANRKA